MLEFGVRLNQSDVQRFHRKLNAYRQGLMDASLDPVKNAGELYCQIVIDHMGQHTGNEMVFADEWWKALSEKWLNIKKSKGLVEEIWEATGETKGYVKIHSAQKTPTGWNIFAGLMNVPIHVLQKALENEFGSEVFEGRGSSPGPTMYIVPARPLFEPSKREILHSPFHRKMLTANFAQALKQALSVAHGQR